MDADDWINSSQLFSIIRKLELCEAQVVILPYHTVDMKTGKRIKQGFYFEDEAQNTGPYSVGQIVENWHMFKTSITFHGIIYKTSFYKEKRIGLIENVFYEDHEYTTIPFCFADSIVPITDGSLYEYLIGNPEQSVAPENQSKRLRDMELVIDHMLDFYENAPRLSNAAKIFFCLKLEILILSYYKAACLTGNESYSGRARTREENKKIFKMIPEFSSAIRKKYNIFVFLSLYNINIYQFEQLINNKLYKVIRKCVDKESRKMYLDCPMVNKRK